MTSYKLKIEHDEDTESPNEYGIGRVVSFNNRHTSFEHPDNWLDVATDCETCGGDGWVEDYSQPDNHNSDECKPCEGTGSTYAVHDDVLATLSYYEHGNCRWMVGESVVPDHGGFDTVRVAGVIVWNGEDNERDWWFKELDDDKRASILAAIADEYTSWSNGECYWYSLEQTLIIHDCPNCGGHNGEGGVDESCGGFIGIDSLVEDLQMTLNAHDIDPGDVEIIGTYGYVLDNHDLEVAAA